MLKLDNNGQSFIYVAAFTSLCIQAKPSIPICTGVQSPGKRVIDNAFGFCK